MCAWLQALYDLEKNVSFTSIASRAWCFGALRFFFVLFHATPHTLAKWGCQSADSKFWLNLLYSWSALDVYNESQGRVELPLLFHCVCVIGVLYSEHQAQLLPAPPPHTNVVLTTRGFYYAIASEPSVPTDGHRNKNAISSKPVTRLSLGLGPSVRRLKPRTQFSYHRGVCGRRVGSRQKWDCCFSPPRTSDERP